MFVLKICNYPAWVKQISMQESAIQIQNSFSKILHRYWCYHIMFTDAKIFSLTTPKTCRMTDCITQHNNRFTALCPGLPKWAGTRRNTHPPTIWSSSSLYQLLPSTTIHSILLVQITCLAIFFAQPLSMSSLVYLLVWSPPPYIPCISSPNQCLLFTAHAYSIAACFAVVSVLYHLFLVILSTPYLELCLLP